MAISDELTALIAERAQGFAGREWVFRSISEWGDGASRVYLLTGGPGTGKTAIAARIVQALHGGVRIEDLRLAPEPSAFFFHFCRAANDTTLDPLRFVERLSTHLAERHPPFLNALASLGDRNVTVNASLGNVAAASGAAVTNVSLSLNVVSHTARQAFDLVVRKPLEALKASGFAGPIFVLVDSLDEAFSYGTENIAALLGELCQLEQSTPVPLRFLLTSRPDPRILRLFPSPNLDLVKSPPDSIDDVRRYVTNLLGSGPGTRVTQIAQKIATASAGNFLYARYVIGDLIADGVDLSTVDLDAMDLPDDIEHQYRRFLARELGKDPAKWTERYQPILGLLAIAQAPGLHADAIAGAVNLKRSIVDAAIQASAQYLEGPIPDGPLRLYHQSFRDFLLAEGPYQVYATESHAALGRYLIDQNAGQWMDADEYALRNAIVPHLVRAVEGSHTKKEARELADQIAAQLTDVDFVESHVRRGLVFDLVTVFVQGQAQLPDDHPWRPMVILLAELLRSEAHFIARHPQAMFQALWNRGWWYDAPAAASFYNLPDACTPSWTKPGNRMSSLLEEWRTKRALRAQPWLRALRPLPDPLGSAQLAVFPIAERDESCTIGLSPDERRLVVASGEDGGSVVAFDLVKTGEQVAALAFDAGRYVSSMAVSPRGDVVAVSLGDSSLRLLDALTLREIGQLIPPAEGDPGEADHDSLMDALAFSPDGRLLVAGNWDGQLMAWEIAPRGPSRLVAALGGKVTALVFSPDGAELSIGTEEGGGGAYYRWDVAGADAPAKVADTEDWVTRLAYARSGDSLACTLYSEDVIIFDRAGSETRRFRLRNDEHGECVAFTADGAALLVGSGDVFGSAYVNCWDTRTGGLRWRLPGHNFHVRDLIVSRDGSRMITAGDSTIRLWDLDQLMKGNLLMLRENDVDRVQFSPDGSTVYTASAKSEAVCARDTSSSELLREWTGHDQGVHALAISPDGQTLACGCGSGVVRIWDTATGAARRSVEQHTTEVEALAFSPDNRVLATGAHDGRVHLVDLATGTARMLQHNAEGWMQRAVFSDDGRLLLTGDYDQLRVWDVTTGNRQSRFKAETFYDGCFTEDGRHVVLEGVAEALGAWDVETGKPVPVDDHHRRAMDRRRRRNERRWAWDRVDRDRDPPELTLCEATTHTPIAWLSLPYGGIVHHPSGEIWGIRRGGHFHLYKLETR